MPHKPSTVAYDYSIKCVVLGNSGVGKTCLIQRFNDKKKPVDEPFVNTMSGELHPKVIPLKDANIRMQLWDTAGQETYKSVTRIYYKGATCCVLCYDITRRQSFIDIGKWLTEFQEQCCNDDYMLALLGTKIDLEKDRQVTQEEGQAFASKHNMIFLETSAVTGANVKEAFTKLVFELYENIKMGKIVPDAKKNSIKLPHEDYHTSTLDALTSNKKPAKKGCCIIL